MIVVGGTASGGRRNRTRNTQQMSVPDTWAMVNGWVFEG